MALQIQRLGLNAIRSNLRTLSLSIGNEKLPVKEVTDPLSSIFITQLKKCPLNKDIQTTEDHVTFLHTMKKWHPSSLGLEKSDVTAEKNELVSRISSKQRMKPECVLFYNQTLDDIFINDRLEKHRHRNSKKMLHENPQKHESLGQTCHACAIDQINLESLTSSVLLCSDSNKPPSKEPSDKTPGKPSLEQLENIRTILSEELPFFFKKMLRYNIYDKNVIFENNIWNKKTVGLGKYSVQMMLIRTFAGFKYVNVKMVLMKVTTHPEEGTVKVRWRIAGLPNSAAIKFWRYYPGRFRQNMKEDTQWTDGLSTFYIGESGLVTKHIADNMIPDDEVHNVNPVVNPKIAPVGLMSKTEINNSIQTIL